MENESWERRGSYTGQWEGIQIIYHIRRYTVSKHLSGLLDSEEGKPSWRSDIKPFYVSAGPVSWTESGCRYRKKGTGPIVSCAEFRYNSNSIPGRVSTSFLGGFHSNSIHV